MKRLLSSLICAWAVMATTAVHAKEPTAAVGAAMTEAAQKFLASLTPAEAAKATMKFDDPLRRDWHNIPKPERKGLQYREMKAPQRELCHNLIKASLSKVGYEKATRIMALENNLLEGEKGKTGTPFRDPERYFLTVFGKPDAKGIWGWSFEGHHFSLNFVVQDGEVVGDTPSFWGANPATVHIFIPGGPEKGVRTLANEEQLAFDLVNSLNEAQQKKAIVATKAPDDYRNAGKPEPPTAAPEGLAASEMTDAQKKTLWSLLENYSGNLAPELAANRLAEIKAAGVDKLHFAWFGSTKPGVGHYYRVQGPSFVLELVNIQSDPAGNPANHIHSVWRSLTHDFGVASK